jgi:GMP synthase-like glutamine amidotransferase
MTRIHCFQHVPYESPEYIAAWAAEHHYPVSVSHLYEGETAPAPDEFDWLVVLGGPMGVADEATHPWLTAEMGAIETAIARGKTIVGVCLGAQLIAHVLGARVYGNPVREIGWFEVRMTGAAERHSLTADLPESFTPFHWHGDTFDLPSGAVHLARSEACANQMYAVGNNILGIQFHLEMTERVISAIAEHNAEQIVPGPTVQARDEMLGENSNLQAGYDIMDSILGRL